MKTFLLFLYGTFEDLVDIEFFCMEVLGTSPAVSSIRFVIENDKNIIVIFESEIEKKQLSSELYNILINDTVKFYFLFERESIYSANLPVQMKDFIFKPADNHTSLRIEYPSNLKTQEPINFENMDLDIILEKIEKFGVDSLSDDEKNFLDNFES
jgi:hypothetical protein